LKVSLVDLTSLGSINSSPQYIVSNEKFLLAVPVMTLPTPSIMKLLSTQMCGSWLNVTLLQNVSYIRPLITLTSDSLELYLIMVKLSGFNSFIFSSKYEVSISTLTKSILVITNIIFFIPSHFMLLKCS
jgi:hypothetical protein